MTQIELIKQEIERRKENYNNDCLVQGHIKAVELDDLLAFIESLEKEQDVVLDKEIDEVWEHDKVFNPESYDKGYELQLDKTNLTNLAHHFYELGFGAREDVPKIKGWVARDKDGTLHFFSSECGDGEPLYYGDSGTWYTATGDMLEIVHPNGAFGELSFIDEPIEVELTIRKV